jgi:NAD(P)-dependent dehydrogenase (short-subunit alcohol dehydrogenase family)
MSSPQNLRGKVALVTGGRRGIGRAAAEELASRGADVVVLDNDGDQELSELSKQLAVEGRKSAWYLADVRSAADLAKVTAAVEADFGGIDILVNNAAVESVVPLLELTEEEFSRVIDTILRGSFLCLQQVARRMVAARRAGAIVNLGSVQVRSVLSGRWHYAAAKRAVEALTAHAANELGRYGIRVNTVNPGMIATAMTEAVMHDPAALKAATERIALGRPGQPREVAKVISFLASDDASYMTGQSVYVDGGYRLG